MASLKEAAKQKQAEEKENPFKPAKGPNPNHPRKRVGKTRRDREAHAAAKNQENKDIRASWQNDTKRPPFPIHTCNGKRNRYQWTGKGGNVVHITDKK